MHALDIGKLRRQVIEQNHLTASGLVQHCHLNTIAKRGTGICLHGADIFDADMVANLVVGQMYADIGDPCVSADGAV